MPSGGNKPAVVVTNHMDDDFEEELFLDDHQGPLNNAQQQLPVSKQGFNGNTHTLAAGEAPAGAPQVYIQAESFPTEFVRKWHEKGYVISSVAYRPVSAVNGRACGIIVMTQHCREAQHSWHLTDGFPKDIIKSSWEAGRNITLMSSWGNQYLTVFLHKSAAVLSNAEYRPYQHGSFSDTPDERYDRGIFIATLGYYHRHDFVLRVCNRGRVQQHEVLFHDFPHEWIAQQRTKGFIIQAATYIANKEVWYIVMGLPTHPVDQIYHVDPTWDEDKINLAMRQGYKVNFVTAGGGMWLTCLSMQEPRTEQLCSPGVTDVPLTPLLHDAQRIIVTNSPAWPEDQVRPLLSQGYLVSGATSRPGTVQNPPSGILMLTKQKGTEGTYWLRDDYPADEIKASVFAADATLNIAMVSQWHNKWLLLLRQPCHRNLRISTKYTRDLEAGLADIQRVPAAVTGMAFKDGLVFLIGSAGTGYDQQKWVASQQFPADWVEAQLANGLIITDIAYDYQDGRWNVIASRTYTGHLQVVALRIAWDQNFADTMVAAGYKVSCIASGPDVVVACFIISPEDFKRQQHNKQGKKFRQL